LASPEFKIPPLIPVNHSSNVVAHGHDGISLYVRYARRNGRTALYRYPGVSPKQYADLTAAPSLGAHIHIFIRPHFSGLKIEES